MEGGHITPPPLPGQLLHRLCSRQIDRPGEVGLHGKAAIVELGVDDVAQPEATNRSA
jgi:hypothetical protein